MGMIKKILLIIVLMCSCAFSVKAQMLDISRRPGSGLTEQEYLYAFTEATRYYLFGNYSQAVVLFRECLKLKPQSSAVHFQLAKIFLNSGNTQFAREHSKKAYLYDKQNKWYAQQLADIYQIEGKYDSAAFIAEQMVALDPDNIAMMFGIVALYERTENYSKAFEFMDRIDAKVGISKEVAISRYRMLSRLGKSEPALEQLKTASKLSADDNTVIAMIAEYYNANKVMDSARYYYQKIPFEMRQEPMVIFSYADFLIEEGMLDSAKALIMGVMTDNTVESIVKAGYFFSVLQNEGNFRKLLPIINDLSAQYYNHNQSDVRAMSIYADIQLRLRNYAKASHALKAIVEGDASNYPAVEQYVYTLNLLGKTDSVILYSERALQRFKDKAFLYLLNGSAKLQNKDYERALLVLENGLSLANEKAVKIEFYSLIGECYQQLGKFNQSDEAFRKALELDEDNILIKNNFAYYLALRSKDLKFAKKLSQATIKAEPENATYLDTYAWVLFKMGNKGAAAKVIEKALLYDKESNTEILEHAAEIFYEMKEYNKAIELLNRVIQLSDKAKDKEILHRIAEMERRL